MDNFVLLPRISPSDNEFRQKIGVENWEIIKNDLLRQYTFTCQGCKLALPKTGNWLEMHIISGSVEDVNTVDDLQNIDKTILCKACHTTQHINMVFQKEYIKFVNSYLSQTEIIKKAREGIAVIKKLMDDKVIIEIKNIDIEAYLKKLEIVHSAQNSKVKILLSDNFDWSKAK